MAQANPAPQQPPPAAAQSGQKPTNQELYEAEKKRLEEEQARKEQREQERQRRKQRQLERKRLAEMGKVMERMLTYGMLIFLIYMISLLPWGAIYRWVMYG
ncbi:hypothetical protein D5125_07030 [Magnetovirga frankeli]|uniref:hypothetical protein n=1 Tax=Magnetovirga frankeli TaxID=947516 RepID=UPI00129411BA|nr:hypothetical protein D5125_07030 [gamma proteobacterium SS-5]